MDNTEHNAAQALEAAWYGQQRSHVHCGRTAFRRTFADERIATYKEWEETQRQVTLRGELAALSYAQALRAGLITEVPHAR